MRTTLTALFFSSWLALAGTGHADVSDPQLREILQGYVEQRGGRYTIQDLNSLRWEGSLSQNGQHVTDVIVIQKRPHMIRLVMQQAQRKVTLGYDGTTCWMRTAQNGHLLESTVLEGMEAANLIRECDLIDPLVSYRDSSYTYQLLEEQTLNGTEAYVIEVTRPKLPGSERYYLSKDDLKLLQRTVDAPNNKGETEETTSIFEDYRSVKGVLLPYTILTQVNKNTHQSLRWNSIEPNAGVFDYYFEPPN